MDMFYSWKPDEDDKTGHALKNTFASNFIQTGLDSQVAKSAAYRDAEITSRLMQNQADLERSTSGHLMEKEFAYRSAAMGQKYDLENRFDQKAFERQQLAAATRQTYDLDKMTKSGFETRRTEDARIRTTGAEQRATDTNSIRETGAQARLTDTNRIQEGGRQTRLTNTQLDQFKQSQEKRENTRANRYARSF